MQDYVAAYGVHLAGTALLLYAAYFIYDTLQKPSSKVPGPWHTKWTRLVLEYYWLRGERSYWVHELHQKYGPIVRIAPDYVDSTDITGIKTIYATKETFRKAKWYRILATSEKHNLFNTTDIDIHRRQRRLLAGPMAESSLKTVLPQINARVDMAIAGIRSDMENHGVADVFKWWLFLATDVIGELTFGESFRMLEQGKKTQYVLDLESIGRLGAIRSVFPWMTWVAPYFPLPIIKRVAASVRRLREYALESLQRYSYLVDTDPSRVKQTLFTKLFKAEEEDTMSFEEITVNAQTYIIAGSDTTANTLTYLVWSVCRDPEVRHKLVKELQTLPKDFDEPDLRELPYLDHVISETLRLYSAAPSGLPREVPVGGAEIGGHWLNGGTVVCSQAYSMHRNPNVFPNPDKFNPSRWESVTQDMKDSSMPFGKGARVCIGLHLAMIELRLATARFFTQFPNATVSTRDGMCDADMKPVIYFLLTLAKSRCLIEAA